MIVWESGHLGVVGNVVAAECKAKHFSNMTLTDNTTKVQCESEMGWVVPHPCVQGEKEGTPREMVGKGRSNVD